MFERFTTQARAVVHDARRHSGELGHHYIGTEHLLLALLEPPAGISYAVLSDAGLTVERVRSDVEAYLADERDRENTVLSREDAEALEAIGIDLDAVRAKIEESFGPGALIPPPRPRRGLFRRRRRSAPSGTTTCVPFTGRSKKVLELSLREAIRLKNNHIGTEHILLGLIREGEGLGAKVIYDAGISLDDLRRRTLDSLRDAAA
jgi:ATP-dependent Clp protease ATP-binding subunit ClpA